MFIFLEPVIKAHRPKWKTTRSAKRVGALANRMSAAVNVHLVHGIQRFKKKIPDKEAIYQAWLKGNYGGIVNIIPWKDLYTDLLQARNNLEEGFNSAMKASLKTLPPNRQPNLRYDYKNPRIQRIFERRSGEWITNIEQTTRQSIQTIVHAQFTNALSPRQMANQIKDTIGLYPKLATAHANYVKGLQAQKIPEDKVERLGDKYYDKLLDYRSMMIARTESQFMANRGQLEVWREAKNQDLLPAEAKKVWVVDGDPCEICEPMDGVAVGLDEMWSLNNGDIVDIPTEAHPHCFCIMEIQMGDEGDLEE